MNEIIRQKQIANFKEQLEKDRTISLSFTKVLWPKTTSSYTDTEQVEFKMQVEVNPTEHKNNTVKVLNAVSTMTQTAKESIVLIETIGFVT